VGPNELILEEKDYLDVRSSVSYNLTMAITTN